MLVLNRLSQTVLVLLVAALVSFALIRYVGDPVNNMVGQSATIADRLAMREQLGLDDPVLFQFARFVEHAVTGDLGISYRYNLRVSSLLLDRLPATLELSVCATLIAVVFGILLGVWTALHRRSLVSQTRP